MTGLDDISVCKNFPGSQGAAAERQRLIGVPGCSRTPLVFLYMAIAFEDLRGLHDSGALYAILSQLLMNEGVEQQLGGEFDWAADLDADSLVFTGRASGATISTSVELMATVAPSAQSMMWGRAQPGGGGAGAQRILDRGGAENLPSLLNDEVPLPDDRDPYDTAADVAQEISAVVAAVTDGGLTSVVPVGGGTIAVLLLGDLDFARPRIDHRLVTRVPMVLGAGLINDHRNAVHGLAVMSGWTIDWTQSWDRADLSDPVTGNRSAVAFDEYGRLGTLEGALS
ncbi:DUF6882 domain-containing protein [Mycolicibacterium arseniciresistens]|uniref:Uncharacterized protein n=1 Tax=Mycolicibacterium arseniciresistens TaxID=3062257 RepID=A0ABT8UDC7_9MYCO|nr:DUF6882 domain-containing protein [Mycolicibacterium arseniciresistens]MDO3635796.1 hypothetical protein [Mycolicibacterium arseniciresistens]